MPRRNRNARYRFEPDELVIACTDEISEYYTLLGLPDITLADGKYPCQGCGRRGFWHGDYCLPCKGRITLDARARLIRGR